MWMSWTLKITRVRRTEDCMTHTEYVSPHFLRLTYLDQNKSEVQRTITVTQKPLYSAYISAFAMCQKAQRMYAALSPEVQGHPCFVTQRTTGEACFLDIQDTFFETQTIALWGINWLRRVLRNYGIFQRECFRRSFVPLLKVVLDFFLMVANSWQARLARSSCVILYSLAQHHRDANTVVAQGRKRYANKSGSDSLCSVYSPAAYASSQPGPLTGLEVR